MCKCAHVFLPLILLSGRGYFPMQSVIYDLWDIIFNTEVYGNYCKLHFKLAKVPKETDCWLCPTVCWKYKVMPRGVLLQGMNLFTSLSVLTAIFCVLHWLLTSWVCVWLVRWWHRVILKACVRAPSKQWRGYREWEALPRGPIYLCHCSFSSEPDLLPLLCYVILK